MNREVYDVVIIGGGVVGCAIARELSKKEGDFCLLEKEDDICCQTSKANSGIIHAGFDAKPGTLKALLNVRGNELMGDLAKELDIPFVRNGSLVVRTKDQPGEALRELYDKGLANQVPGLRIIDERELKTMEPNLAEDVVEALYAPTGGIVCPFHMTIAFAENACMNGVEFSLQTRVTGIRKEEEFVISCCREYLKQGKLQREEFEIRSRALVNAAGLYADVFHNMICKQQIHIIPRKGEYLLLDKTAGSHVARTIFQLPGKMGKGVLVSPTVHGNLLVGPTALDTEDPEAVNTTLQGLGGLPGRAALSVKNLPVRQVITSFAGLRAHEEQGDFIIGEAKELPGFFDAAGIESPGLTSAPAIAEYLCTQITERLSLQDKELFIPFRRGILNPAKLSMEERNKLIAAQPAYGQIICRCEMISEGEIIDAIRRPLGARSLDAIKRRTRAGMGRCQAGFCSPKTMEILQRETGMSIYDITKNGHDSAFVIGRNKEIGGKSHE